MKKYYVLALLALFVAVYVHFSGSSKENEAETIQDVKVLRVGAECNYVPNSWEESLPSRFNVQISNREGFYADGYDIQIAKIVAQKLGRVLEVHKIEWNDLLPSLNNGKIDAVFSSMLDTEDRRKVAAFSEPYEVRGTEYGIIVDSVGAFFTAASLEDFNGARIIGQRGTRLEEVIQQIPGVIRVAPGNSVQEVVDAILEDKADGAVIETDTGHYYEIMNNNLTLIKFPADKGFKLGFHGVCAAVRKKDKDLLKKINDIVAEIPRNQRQKIMDDTAARMIGLR